MPKLHTLYIAPGSSSCRSVLYHLSRIAKYVDGQFEIGGGRPLYGDTRPKDERVLVAVTPVDLSDGSHVNDLSPFNPMHTVPTLVTPHGPLWESRAIMLYLSELAQMANPEAWTYYPRRLYQRSVVNRLLNWDVATFYRAISGVVYPQAFRGEQPKHEDLEALTKALSFLNEIQLTDGRPFLTGTDVTVADISIATGASMLRLINLEVDEMPLVYAWLARMNELPGWAEVRAPFDAWVAQATAEPEAGDAPDEPAAEAEAETAATEPEATVSASEVAAETAAAAP